MTQRRIVCGAGRRSMVMRRRKSSDTRARLMRSSHMAERPRRPGSAIPIASQGNARIQLGPLVEQTTSTCDAAICGVAVMLPFGLRLGAHSLTSTRCVLGCRPTVISRESLRPCTRRGSGLATDVAQSRQNVTCSSLGIWMLGTKPALREAGAADKVTPWHG